MQRERRVANYIFLLYAGVSSVILSTPLSGPVVALKTSFEYLWNPVPFAGSHAVERLTGIPSGAARLISVDAENTSLRQQLKQMPLAESEMASLRRENERLRNMLGIKPTHGHILRWARVMERDPQNWYRYLTIDEGADDGLALGDPVVGVENGRLGAVGRVTELGPHWAKVLLITDELSSIAAYIPSKQWEGLIEGQGKEQLMMNYLPADASLAIGDMVYASATSLTFPPDILIGNVTQIFPEDPFLTFRSVAVVPAIHVTSLKEVALLRPVKAQPANPS